MLLTYRCNAPAQISRSFTATPDGEALVTGKQTCGVACCRLGRARGAHRKHFLRGGSAEDETALAHKYECEHEDQRGHPYYTRGHGNGRVPGRHRFLFLSAAAAGLGLYANDSSFYRVLSQDTCFSRSHTLRIPVLIASLRCTLKICEGVYRVAADHCFLVN